MIIPAMPLLVEVQLRLLVAFAELLSVMGQRQNTPFATSCSLQFWRVVSVVALALSLAGTGAAFTVNVTATVAWEEAVPFVN